MLIALLFFTVGIVVGENLIYTTEYLWLLRTVLGPTPFNLAEFPRN